MDFFVTIFAAGTKENTNWQLNALDKDARGTSKFIRVKIEAGNIPPYPRYLLGRNFSPQKNFSLLISDWF